MAESKYKELSKNTLLFTISSFGTRIIQFLLVPLYTYVLTTEEYGTIDVLYTTISLMVPLLTLNIQDAVLRFCLDKEYEPENIISTSVRLLAFSSFIFAAGTLFIKGVGWVSLGWEYICFLILSFIFNAFQNSFSMYLKAIDRVSVIVISGLLTTLLTCGLNLFFLLYCKLGVNGYLYAHLISAFTGLIYCLIFGEIYKNIGAAASKKILKSMLVYSSPLIVNSLAWWLNDASDRYILIYFCGTAVNGIYAISYKIPTILSTIQSVFYNAWSVSAIKEFNKNDEDGFVGNIYSLYSCVSIIACSCLLLLNPLLAKILYAKDFFEAWKYVPALLVGVIFNGLSLFEGCLFTAVKRTKDVSKTTIIGAIANFVLNIILIPNIGAYGAATATLIGYMVVWIVRTVMLKDIIHMRVNWRNQLISLLLILVQGVCATIGNTMAIQLIIMIMILFMQRQFIGKTISFIVGKILK